MRPSEKGGPVSNQRMRGAARSIDDAPLHEQQRRALWQRRALGLEADSPAQPTSLLLLGGLALGAAALAAVVGAQVVRRGRRGGPSRAAAGLLAFGHLEGVSSHN